MVIYTYDDKYKPAQHLLLSSWLHDVTHRSKFELSRDKSRLAGGILVFRHEIAWYLPIRPIPHPIGSSKQTWMDGMLKPVKHVRVSVHGCEA